MSTVMHPPPVDNRVPGAPFGAEQARSLIESYRAEVPRCEPKAAARLLHEVARLYEEALDDPASALAAVEDALGLDPAAPLALGTGVRLLLASDQPRRAATLLQRASEAAHDTRTRISTLLDLAALQELRLGDAERAIETYELIRVVDPTNLPALEALLRLHLGRSSWERVRELCSELALAEKDPPTRCSLLLVAALLSASAEERGRRLDLCLATGALRELALALALPGLEAEGWQRVVEALIQGSGERPPPAVAQHQASWILAEHLGQPGAAVSHARRAVELAPDEVSYWAWLAGLLRREARWEEFVEALQQLAALANRSTACVDLLLTSAWILDSRLHLPDRAVSELATVLELEPDNVLAPLMLEALFVRSSRWEEALQLHLGRAERRPGTVEQAEALFRAAEIQAHRLGRVAEAMELLRRAVSIADHPPSVRLLERLYRQDERWAELAELLHRQANHSESAARRRGLLTDVAGLHEHRLGDHEGALAVLAELDRLPPDPLHAIWTIVRLGEESGDTTAAQSALRALESRADSPRERAAVVHRLAQLIEDRVGDPAAALLQLRRATEIDPTLPGPRDALLRQIVLLQRWPELVEHLEERLAEESRSDRRFALLRALAWLLAQVTEQRGPAASTYRQALAVAPEGGREPALQGLLRVLAPDDLERLPGPRELERLQGRRQAAASLLRLGQQLLDLEECREEAAGTQSQVVLQRASRLDPTSELARYLLLRSLLRQGDLEGAIDALPPLGAALLALGGLRQSGRARELVGTHLEHADDEDALAVSRWLDLLSGSRGTLELESLTARAGLEVDPARRRDVLYRLAAGAELRAQDGVNAVSLYRAILDDLPREERALRALQRLGHGQQDLALRLEALEGLAGVAARENACSLLAERASLLLQLDNEEEAVAIWRRALQEDPGCRPAYYALRCLYWERGDTEGLSWALERGLDAVSHPRAVTGDLLQRAGFREQRGDVPGALADLERVLSLNPGLPEAVEREVRLLRQHGDIDLLQRRLEHAAQHTASPRRQAQLLLELATLRRDQLNDPAGAHLILSRAIGIDPDNVEALVQAAELQVRLDQPTEALALLNRVVLRTSEGETWLQAHLRMAHICAHLLDDLPRARAGLEAVLEREPACREALVRLVELAEQQGDVARLERDLRRLAEVSEEGPQRAAVLARLAETVRGHEGAEALQLLQRAVELDPGDPRRLRDLVRALEGAGRWSDLDRLLERRIEGLDPLEQLPFLLVHGRVLGRHLDRLAEARAVLHQVLAGDPENRAAMELLLDQIEGGARDPAQLDEAIDLHRRLLRRNPLTVDSIRALHRLCNQRGRSDEGFCAGGCLAFLDEATEEERYFHRRLRENAPAQPAGTLTGEQIARLALPAGDHPLRPLLGLLREYLPALLPPDLSHFGIEPGAESGAFETARLAANHAAWDVASICSGVLRLGHFELAEARGGAPHGVCLPGDPPVLLLPRNFLRLPMPDQLFLCGRLLARIAVHTEALDPGRRPSIRVRDLELLQVGLLRHAGPRVNGDPTPETIVADMARRVERLLPTAQLDRARELAREVSVNRESWAPWLRSTELGACRAGLLCSGGLDALAPFWTHDGPITADLQRELLLFALSEEYAEDRAHLGLALPAQEPSWR